MFSFDAVAKAISDAMPKVSRVEIYTFVFYTMNYFELKNEKNGVRKAKEIVTDFLKEFEE